MIKETNSEHPLVKAVINLGATDNPIDYDIQLEREQEEAFYNEANGQVKERLDSEISGRNVGNYSTQIIKPMKKFQLLEKAIRDYPAGTKIYSTSNKGQVSPPLKGVYHINEYGSVEDSSSWLVYNGTNGTEWALIVTMDTNSILSGKCAIQVNNEREFKLLMEHYESKGWKWEDGGKCYPIDKLTDNQLKAVNYKTSVMYQDGFLFNPAGKQDWQIIPFDDFARECGIKVPVFVMKSEDYVDLYVGDKYYVASKFMDWQLVSTDPMLLVHSVRSHSLTNKAFSTKTAAESWIKQMNKPKEIVIQFDSSNKGVITSDKVVIQMDNGNMSFELSSTFIEQIYSAYKSLQ